MVKKPADTKWLVNTPSFKAGYSLNQNGEVFVHLEGGAHDFRLVSYVNKNRDKFFADLSRVTGEFTAYAVIPSSDTKLNKLAIMAGMIFIKDYHGHKIYYRMMG